MKISSFSAAIGDLCEHLINWFPGLNMERQKKQQQTKKKIQEFVCEYKNEMKETEIHI